MIAAVRNRLTYSNVIGTMALFIALGGVAVAAGLPRNSVGPNQLKRGAVTAAKIRKQAVTSAKLANGAVTIGKLAANSVGPGNIGNGAVTTAKLAKSSVIAEPIKNGIVTTNKLNTEAVTAPKLGKGSVTAAKLSDEVGPLLGNLKSGQTLRGVFDMGAASEVVRGANSFQFPLAKSPGISPTDILKFGQTNANCPGVGSGEETPQAAPGRLCVYIKLENGLSALTLDTVNRLGFGLAAIFTAPSKDNEVSGMWAVTAP